MDKHKDWRWKIDEEKYACSWYSSFLSILGGILSNDGDTELENREVRVLKQHEVAITESPITTSSIKLSVEELLNCEGHPRIFDSYSATERFYKKIGDKRVVITNGVEKASNDMKYETIESDTNVLYFVQHSTSPEHIGTVEIRIFDPKYRSKITLNQVVKLMNTYLPENFSEYYKLDAAFIHKLKQLTTYTYACRLNDAGIEYCNSQARQYSNYYYFKIYKYSSGGWIIETGYSAYGGKDKGWIEKNTEPWDVEL